MDELLRLNDPLSYAELMELTFDGLAFRISATCWAPVGMAVDTHLRAQSIERAPLHDLVLSHRSAHWVWWGSGLAPVVSEYTTRTRRRIRAGRLPIVVHERTVGPAEESHIAGLALTSPERTLYDLFYELLDASVDDERLERQARELFDSVSPEQQLSFIRYVAEQYRRPHLAAMRRLLKRLNGSAGTVLSGR